MDYSKTKMVLTCINDRESGLSFSPPLKVLVVIAPLYPFSLWLEGTAHAHTRKRHQYVPVELLLERRGKLLSTEADTKPTINVPKSSSNRDIPSSQAL